MDRMNEITTVPRYGRGTALVMKTLLLLVLGVMAVLPAACKSKIGTNPTRTVAPTPTYTLGPGCSTPVLRDISGYINNGPVTGDTCGFWDRFEDHGRGVDSPDNLYLVRVDSPTTLTASLCDGNTYFDTYLYLRSSCSVEGTDLAFDDDFCMPNTQSQITAILAPGTYYLIVDGYGDPVDCGTYSLVLTDGALTPTPTITLVAYLSPTHTPTPTSTPTPT